MARVTIEKLYAWVFHWTEHPRILHNDEVLSRTVTEFLCDHLDELNKVAPPFTEKHTNLAKQSTELLLYLLSFLQCQRAGEAITDVKEIDKYFSYKRKFAGKKSSNLLKFLSLKEG